MLTLSVDHEQPGTCSPENPRPSPLRLHLPRRGGSDSLHPSVEALVEALLSGKDKIEFKKDLCIEDAK